MIQFYMQFVVSRVNSIRRHPIRNIYIFKYYINLLVCVKDKK